MPHDRVLRATENQGRPIQDLNILFVTHAFPPESWAGVEVYTLELARELARRGHALTVLTRSPPNAAVQARDYHVREDEVEALRVLRMTRDVEGIRLGASYRDPRSEKVFRSILEDVAPDVVHFQHVLHLSAGMIGVAEEAGVPSVLTCHDYWSVCARVQLVQPDGTRCEKNRGMGCFTCIQDWGRVDAAERWLGKLGPLVRGVGGLSRVLRRPSVKVERWVQAWRDVRERQDYVLGMFARADRLIAPSRFLRDVLLASGRLDPERFLYSDYGTRPARETPARREPDPEGRLRLGFVGTLNWYKGGEVLIEAMNRLAGTPAILNVFGAFEPARDPFHARLAESASAGNVVFHGRLPNDRIEEAYRVIDVLVVPSIWFENSPITIHEALQRNVPLLVSDIGGMAELVEDGVSGLHFAVGDAEDLARAMQRLIDEPELLERLRASRVRVKTMEENAAELEALYGELIAARAKQS